jgi:Flp pilus assembly protein TadD
MMTPRQALAVLPDNAALLNSAGLAESGRAAIAWFRRAVLMAPDQAEPHANLSAALLSLALTDEALIAARTSVTLAPNKAEGWNNLGNARLGEADFQRARRLTPDFTDACINESGLRLDRGAA